MILQKDLEGLNENTTQIYYFPAITDLKSMSEPFFNMRNSMSHNKVVTPCFVHFHLQHDHCFGVGKQAAAG